MKSASAFLVLILATSLTGCISAKDRALRNSQPYRVGYSDGCLAAGNSDLSYRSNSGRNEEAYNSNAAYRAGWKAGFSYCRHAAGGPGSDNGNPIPDPSPR